MIHDKSALHEVENNAYLKNTVNYDTNNDFLSIIRHESLYGAFILTENTEIDKNHPIGNINSLSDLIEDIHYYNNYLSYPIQIGNDPTQIYTYGICLFNKWCGFNKVIFNKTVTKKQNNLISKLIFEQNNKNTGEYYKQLTELNKKLLFFVSIIEQTPSLNLDDMINILDDDISQLFKKLPSNNIYLGYYINEALIDRCIDKFDKSTGLYKLFRSGSRFNKKQLARSCINIGYTANAENIIEPKPIMSNLMSGITPEDFFLCSPGSRKGISDKSNATPQSGYLERTLTMGLSPLEITEHDCGGHTWINITVFSEKHAETLIDKYYKPTNILSPNWEIITPELCKKLVNTNILLRSPITCSTPNFKMCRMCFGEKQFPTKYVGITAAQCLAERLTQLTMRSFHDSGSANLACDENVKNFIKNNLINISYDKKETILHFKTNEYPELIFNIPGFKKFDGNKIIFEEYLEVVQNKDAISVMQKIKDLLKTCTENIKSPAEYYEEFMATILEVGAPYSSFVEMLFANMFITDKENKIFWRYDQSSPIVLKLGDKNLAENISSLLGLLYKPNKRTLEIINDLDKLKLNPDNMNIYERIWLGEFD